MSGIERAPCGGAAKLWRPLESAAPCLNSRDHEDMSCMMFDYIRDEVSACLTTSGMR